MVEFTSRLIPVKGVVRVDGDPQHAGLHFRADNEGAEKTFNETFLRPGGRGKPGETRNWEPKTKQGQVNLPRDAMSFVVCGQRFTVAYLDHPFNPKQARGSERDYGRLGSYFVSEADRNKPLTVRYRVWLQSGELPLRDAADLSAAFVDPLQVSCQK